MLANKATRLHPTHLTVYYPIATIHAQLVYLPAKPTALLAIRTRRLQENPLTFAFATRATTRIQQWTNAAYAMERVKNAPVQVRLHALYAGQMHL